MDKAHFAGFLITLILMSGLFYWAFVQYEIAMIKLGKTEAKNKELERRLKEMRAYVNTRDEEGWK